MIYIHFANITIDNRRMETVHSEILRLTVHMKDTPLYYVINGNRLSVLRVAETQDLDGKHYYENETNMSGDTVSVEKTGMVYDGGRIPKPLCFLLKEVPRDK